MIQLDNINSNFHAKTKKISAYNSKVTIDSFVMFTGGSWDAESEDCVVAGLLNLCGTYKVSILEELLNDSYDLVMLLPVASPFFPSATMISPGAKRYLRSTLSKTSSARLFHSDTALLRLKCSWILLSTSSVQRAFSAAMDPLRKTGSLKISIYASKAFPRNQLR